MTRRAVCESAGGSGVRREASCWSRIVRSQTHFQSAFFLTLIACWKSLGRFEVCVAVAAVLLGQVLDADAVVRTAAHARLVNNRVAMLIALSRVNA